MTESDQKNEYIDQKGIQDQDLKFGEMSPHQLMDILGLTIKQDNANKALTLLCFLSAYSEDSQFNISFNAPSSTGKSYIPLEIANLFPKEDVIELGGASPTAFIHEQGDFDKPTNTVRLDFSRKIIVFMEQPHSGVSEKLRSMLSHDRKEIVHKIADKNQHGSTATKTIIIRGYPAVVYCTAGLNIDEQELTRFLLLSPEMDQEKLRAAIHEKALKEADKLSYNQKLLNDPERLLLIERIKAIKAAEITDINISCPEIIEEYFVGENKTLKPRYMRDTGRVSSIAKSLALLNWQWRERSGPIITANEYDVQNALALWDLVGTSQELGLPPYIYDFYSEIIVVAWDEKSAATPDAVGLTRQDVRKKHFDLRQTMLSDAKLRMEIIPMLLTAGMISEVTDPSGDKRVKLIVPLHNQPIEEE